MYTYVHQKSILIHTMNTLGESAEHTSFTFITNECNLCTGSCRVPVQVSVRLEGDAYSQRSLIIACLNRARFLNF